MTESERAAELHERQNLARDASAVLSNPAFTAAFDQYREKLVAKIEAADLTNPRFTEQMALQLKMLAFVRAQLHEMVAGGDMARRDLERALQQAEEDARLADTSAVLRPIRRGLTRLTGTR